ncbi:DUF7507 domain-containing protein [Sphingobacterium sp. LRF_L2]|uniref:DUF7507 domain-containing protein n=1 Tax=Sphingobacterium sp. LRF_L2 TaxID=3369421 RepID=UPI003F62D37A
MKFIQYKMKDREGRGLLYFWFIFLITMQAHAADPVLVQKSTSRTSTYSKVGEVVEYTVTVTNISTEVLKNLTVNYKKSDNTSFGIATLALGERRTYINSYTITQEDLDEGFIYNEAIVSGQNTGQTTFSVHSVDPSPLVSTAPSVDPNCINCTIVALLQAPKLQFLQTVDRSKRYSRLGEVIPFAITLKNTGNVSLTDLQIKDLVGGSADIAQVARLEVGQIQTYTTTHTITQDDIDRGAVYRQAQVRGITLKGDSINETSVDGNPLGSTDPLLSAECPNCTVAPIYQEAKLSLTKRIDRTKVYSQVGDELDYVITLINTGNVSLYQVSLSDNKATLQESGLFTQLSPGESRELHAKYTLSQSDIDLGAVYSQASVVAQTFQGVGISGLSVDPDPIADSDPLYDASCATCTVIAIQQQPIFTLLKTTDRTKKYSKVGDQVSYQLVIKNTGNIALVQINITDSNADTRNVATLSRLALGEERTFTVVHTVTQSDLNTGAIYNQAEGTAKTAKGVSFSAVSKDGNPITNDDPLYSSSCPDCTVIGLVQSPALIVLKTSDKTKSYRKVGDVIEYNVSLHNSGNVDLRNLVIHDVNADQLEVGTVALLEAGETRTFRTFHTLTQADLDRGAVYNIASVSYQDTKQISYTQTSVDSNPLTSSDSLFDSSCPACTVTPLEEEPQVSLTKTADKTVRYSKVGDVVHYTILLKNIGNQTLFNLDITDPEADEEQVGSVSQIAVGQSVSFVAQHTITQSDLDLGAVYNQAVVRGSSPKSIAIAAKSVDGNPISRIDPFYDSSCPDCTVTALQQEPKLTFTKTADRSKSYMAVGDIIYYSISITNIGNVNLRQLQVFDPQADQQEVGTIATLEVGESKVFVASHTIVQEDITRGAVYNEARLESSYGKSERYVVFSVDGDPLEAADPLRDPNCPNCTVTPVGSQDQLALIKTSDRSKVYNKVGDVITYSIVLINEGNRAATNIVISDSNADRQQIASISTLAVGESRTFTATHTVTQDDLDRGAVYNQAVVSWRNIEGHTLQEQSTDGAPLGTSSIWYDPKCPDCTITVVQQQASLTLLKTTDRTRIFNKVGDVIEYWLTLQNTGNVSIRDVVLTDENSDEKQLGQVSRLAVGQTRTFVASHTLTQADLDRGAVYNIALAEGKDPVGQVVRALSLDSNPLDFEDPTNPPVDPECPSCTITPVEQEGEMTVYKTTDRTKIYQAVGDIITYQLTVINTGNVTLYRVKLSDANADQTAVGTIDVFPVGTRQTFLAQHTITQADIDKGAVYNIAYAKGEDPSGKEVEASSTDTNPVDPIDPDCPDCTVVPVEQIGGMNVIKTSDLSIAYRYVGDKITYTIVVSNTGNTSLYDIEVTDSNADDYVVGNISRLAVGESQSLTAYHSITQADMDRGYVANLAVASGKEPGGDEIEEESESGNPKDPNGPEDPNCPNCTITPLPWKLIEAIDDDFGKIVGASVSQTNSVLDNDRLQGDAVSVTTVQLIPGLSPRAGIDMGADGRISIADNVPAGTYTYTYRICELRNLSNCAQATATFEVLFALIEAVDDYYQGINGWDETETSSVLVNDKINNKVLLGSAVTLKPGTSPHSNMEMAADGTITIHRGISAGTYSYPYQICEVLNPTNCSSATAYIEIIFAPIKATDDTFTVQWDRSAQQTSSVLNNDTFNGSHIVGDEVVLDGGTASHAGLQMQADGVILISGGLRPGIYTYPYKISDVLNPGNYSEAIATINVESELFVPNIFTPNQDGVNDFFEIIGIEQFDQVNLVVINRWGNEVYRSEKYDNTWDGSGLQLGTYFYTIKARKAQDVKILKGWVMIKK